MIDTLVGTGFKVKKCCEELGVSSAGYYLTKTRPMSPTMIRREWLTGLIREVHADVAAPTALVACTPNSPRAAPSTSAWLS